MAVALDVPLGVEVEDAHDVDVPLGRLVARRDVVAQVDAAPAREGVLERRHGRVLAAVVEVEVDAARRLADGRGGRGPDLLERALGDVRADERRAQGLQTGRQGDRLVAGQAHRRRDVVGVVEVDVAAVPLGVDELGVAVAGRAADEEQLEVLDDLVLVDPELVRGLGDRHAAVLEQPRHHVEQATEPLRGRLGGPACRRPRRVALMPVPPIAPSRAWPLGRRWDPTVRPRTASSADRTPSTSSGGDTATACVPRATTSRSVVPRR